MYSLKEYHQQETVKPLIAAKERRHMYPFFFRIQPVTLGLISCALIGLMAILYLNQVAQVTAANQRLQQLNSQHASLLDDNQQMQSRLGQVESPAYIEQQAQQMGLAPSDLSKVHIIAVQPGTPSAAGTVTSSSGH